MHISAEGQALSLSMSPDQWQANIASWISSSQCNNYILISQRAPGKHVMWIRRQNSMSQCPLITRIFVQRRWLGKHPNSLINWKLPHDNHKLLKPFKNIPPDFLFSSHRLSSDHNKLGVILCRPSEYLYGCKSPKCFFTLVWYLFRSPAVSQQPGKTKFKLHFVFQS